MSSSPDALWLNASPALQKFDRPLLRHLAQHGAIAHWRYCQSQDEAVSMATALVLLHDYLKQGDRPVHLLGHGISGALALLYARRHPERVRSLTLLSVGVYPLVDWQAHYYSRFALLPCSRETVLAQMVPTLFGRQSWQVTQELIQLLEKDLDNSLSPHTLYRRASLFPGGVPVPLLVCGGSEDAIIDPNALEGWRPWLKDEGFFPKDEAKWTLPGDRLWQCPGGRYFFHYHFPQSTAEQILDFWQSFSRVPAQYPAFETASTG
jgi:pimeloyl-ACP methyl ester carboxylesterase